MSTSEEGPVVARVMPRVFADVPTRSELAAAQAAAELATKKARGQMTGFVVMLLLLSVLSVGVITLFMMGLIGSAGVTATDSASLRSAREAVVGTFERLEMPLELSASANGEGDITALTGQAAAQQVDLGASIAALESRVDSQSQSLTDLNEQLQETQSERAQFRSESRELREINELRDDIDTLKDEITAELEKTDFELIRQDPAGFDYEALETALEREDPFQDWKVDVEEELLAYQSLLQEQRQLMEEWRQGQLR